MRFFRVSLSQISQSHVSKCLDGSEKHKVTLSVIVGVEVNEISNSSLSASIASLSLTEKKRHYRIIFSDGQHLPLHTCTELLEFSL